MLLVGAGLLMRSFWRLASVDPGFRAEGVQTLAVSMTPARYPDSARLAAYTATVTRRLEEIPGVVLVGVVAEEPGGDFRLRIVGP